PCRDQTRKRIALVHSLAAPSWTAPANHLSIPRNHGSPLVSTRVLQHILPNSGARADIAGLPRRASSGLMQSSNPGADKLRRHACFIEPKLSAVVGQVIDRLWDPRY